MKTSLFVLLGILLWYVLVTLLDLPLRALLEGYRAAEPTFAFTLPMLLARLGISALATLATGWLLQRLSGGRPRTVGLSALLLLATLLPVHVSLWPRFPAWYHLAFLLTLVPLYLLGARVAAAHRNA